MARRAAWNSEAVKLDVAERLGAVAPFLPPDLTSTVGNNVISTLALAASNGNLRQGNEIDEFIIKELNFLKLIRKLPPDIAQQVPLAPGRPLALFKPPAPAPFKPPAPAPFKPPAPAPYRPLAPLRPPESIKRKAAEEAGGAAKIPKKADAVAQFLAKKSNEWFCPLSESCYIKDYDSLGRLSPGLLLDRLPDMSPDRSRSKSSQATIEPDRSRSKSSQATIEPSERFVGPLRREQYLDYNTDDSLSTVAADE